MFKKISFFWVVIILLTFSGCGKNVVVKSNTTASKFELLKFNGFISIGNDLIKSFDAKEDINTIMSSINRSKKIELNTMEFAQADYCINIIFASKSEKGYYLIIHPQDKYALFIDAKDKNIGYSVQKKEVDKLFQLIN